MAQAIFEVLEGINALYLRSFSICTSYNVLFYVFSENACARETNRPKKHILHSCFGSCKCHCVWIVKEYMFFKYINNNISAGSRSIWFLHFNVAEERDWCRGGRKSDWNNSLVPRIMAEGERHVSGKATKQRYI